MTCQVVNSQSQVQARLPPLPANMPQNQGDWGAFIASLNQWAMALQNDQQPINVIPARYSLFQGSTLPTLDLSTGMAATLDTGALFYGASSLKVVSVAAGTLAFDGFPIVMPGAQKWFCSWQIYTSTALTGTLTVTTDAGNSVSQTFSVPSGQSSLVTDPLLQNITDDSGNQIVGTDWQQVWGLFDLRAFQATHCTWKFTFDQAATFWIDGLQMAIGGSLLTQPVPFGNPQAHGSIDMLPDGSTYQRPLATALNAGQVDLSKVGVVGKTLDNISDTTTYARYKAAGMTGGFADPSKGGLTANGSVPPIVLGCAFSWTTTSGQIVITWSAFTIYRPDGTTTSISAGSGTTVTGLTNSTVYTIYPYVVDGQTTVSFVTGKTGSAGSPAICYAGGSGVAASVAYAFANIPLNSFTATPSAGGGGGGGDSVGCPHEDSEVETARGMVRAGDLLVGDRLFIAPGHTAPILTIDRRKRHAWVRVRIAGNSGPYETIVTPEHVFYQPTLSGDDVMLRARDLKLGSLIASEGGLAEVRALATLEQEADSIVLTLPKPHQYYERRGGAFVHNGNPKP